jgi:hypothetical protein
MRLERAKTQAQKAESMKARQNTTFLEAHESLEKVSVRGGHNVKVLSGLSHGLFGKLPAVAIFGVLQVRFFQRNPLPNSGAPGV